MDYTEHASKKYVDERNALLATKTALNAEAEERVRLANIVAQNRRETYTKDEVNRIVEALRGARFVKVECLPELADADTRAIYLVPRTSPETDNRYDEWIVVVDGEGVRSWDKLGSTDIDLSGYATTEALSEVRELAQYVSDKIGEMGEDTVADRLADIENCDEEPTENSEKFVTSGGVFAALKGKQSAVARELFLNVQADVWLSAECGDDANDGLAPDRAVKSIARAYAAAKAAVDAQTLDGSRQVVVAVDEGVYAAAMITSELASGILYRAVGDRERTLVMPKGGTYGTSGAYETAMACVNGEHPRVFEMEGFTFTGFNGDHHYAIAQYQSGIVYGMTLRRCLITGNSPICTKAFVCGTFIDCEITGNTTRPRGNAGGVAPFGGYAAVYDDTAYMTRMFNCHVWDNDFSSFQFFAAKIEAAHCLFENSFAVVKGISDSYGGKYNTMVADRYTNPNLPPSPSYTSFHKIGQKYFAVIASSADCTTDPFYVETDGYVCVQSAELTEDKVAADASCPSVMSDGSPDFGYRDSGLGRGKTAEVLRNEKLDKGRRVFYATSDTAANQSAKTATVSGDGFSLYDGCVVVVKSTYGNSQPSATMDIGGTGAKTVRRFAGNDYPAIGQWKPNDILPLTYDGSGWVMLRPAYATTGTPGIVQLVSSLDAQGQGDQSAPTPNAVKDAIAAETSRARAAETLTPKSYSFGEWELNPSTITGLGTLSVQRHDWEFGGREVHTWRLYVLYGNETVAIAGDAGDGTGNDDEVSWDSYLDPETHDTVQLSIVARRSRSVVGYQLGSQDDKPVLGASRRVFYATCDTAANQPAKSAVVSGDGFSLYDGCIVVVRFTNTNSAYNMTLNVGETGAKPVARWGTSGGLESGAWNGNEAVPFVYDGVSWLMLKTPAATYGARGVVQLVPSVDNAVATGCGNPPFAPTPNAVKAGLDLKQDRLSNGQLANIAAVSDALAFDAAHTYAAGDPVVYNGTLYTFTSAHTGAWTGSDVSAVDIIAMLAGKANDADVVKVPVYDGQNHEFLDAGVAGSAIYGFTAAGAHRWTASRRCIVYLRASHNSDTNKPRLYVHVNNANAGETDYGSMVFMQGFAKNVSVVVPIFLNAGDALDIRLVNDLEQLNYSVFYTD